MQGRERWGGLLPAGLVGIKGFLIGGLLKSGHYQTAANGLDECAPLTTCLLAPFLPLSDFSLWVQVQLLLPCPLVGRSLRFWLIPSTVTLFLGGLAWPDLSPQLDYPAGPFLSGGLRLRGPSLAAPGWEQVAVALHIVGKQFLKNPSPRPHYHYFHSFIFTSFTLRLLRCPL